VSWGLTKRIHEVFALLWLLCHGYPQSEKTQVNMTSTLSRRTIISIKMFGVLLTLEASGK
jgi:hypothetical protein